MVRFAWHLAPLGDVVRVTLYIGRNRDAPHADHKGFKKTLLFPPDDPWDRFNETTEQLGLVPGETYYWQVAQHVHGSGAVLSEVWALHVEQVPLRGRLHLGLLHPTTISHGRPVKLTIGLTNLTDSPLHLRFPTSRHFEVAIYRFRLIGKNQYVWPAPTAAAPQIEVIDVPPRGTHKEVITWPQVDNRGQPVAPGEYVVKVRCTVDDFRAEESKVVIINK